MKSIFFKIFFVLTCTLYSQPAVLCRVGHDLKSIEIKWYQKDLVNDRPVKILRSEDKITWQECNTGNIIFGAYQFSKAEMLADSELVSYQKMCEKSSNIKDLVKIAAIIKSFTSAPFSKYLGILYVDQSVVPGKKYWYKVVLQPIDETSSEIISEPIVAGKFIQVQAPAEIKIVSKKSEAGFSWKAEPMRYYGINIYRQHHDSSRMLKINKLPVLLSGTISEDQKLFRMFSDAHLKTQAVYYYELEAIDFFGELSIHSARIKFQLKDQIPPSAPNKPELTVKGKTVKCIWKKDSIEKDLAGYNVYRTTRNDTDFKKINGSVITVDQKNYLDRLTAFQSYLYKVSAIDKNGNESFSESVMADLVDTEPPRVPENLKIKSDSGKIIIRWEQNKESDLAGYILYRSIDDNASGNYVRLQAKPISENYYTDVLPSGARNRFFYKIVAVDENLNKSAYSNPISMRLPDVQPPTAPFLTCGETSEMVYLKWFRNPEPDLQYYDLYKKHEDDSLYRSEFKKLARISSTDTVYAVSNKNNKGRAVYKIYAIDSTGLRSMSSNEVRSGRAPMPVFKLSAKTTVKYLSEAKSVLITWQIQSLNKKDLIGSVVYRKNFGESSFYPLCGPTHTGEYVDGSVQSESSYQYQVRTYSKDGQVVKSPVLLISTKSK